MISCPSCGGHSAAGETFCSHCGAVLGHRCPQCGAESRPGQRFCGDCGAALPGANDIQAPLRDTPGERRQLTVLFCDLVGSTPLAQQLDPEEWRDVLAQYQQAAAGAVARWGGHVAKNLGDGLLIYFGWPRAREDDPERAVRAGLAIVEAMAPLNAQRGAGDGCGSRCGSACKVDPELDALRGDPRFAALLEKVGLEP